MIENLLGTCKSVGADNIDSCCSESVVQSPSSRLAEVIPSNLVGEDKRQSEQQGCLKMPLF